MKPKHMQFIPAFDSPEFLKGCYARGSKLIDTCRHDVWGVGAIFLYILTNK